ncbi:MAG: phosphatase domain-containing protein [Myxococcota bacterium]
MARVRHIFRWDLDKTYLRTEFDSVRAMVRTARLSAEARENIPGSAALIRAIRQGATEDLRHEIYFVSGSPEQLRSVIEKKFALDGFAPDGFVLKPAVSDLFRARFRAIKTQVPYKLGALLTGRAQAPIGAKETLLGDDAESDAFIYTFYAELVRGGVGDKILKEVLRRARAYDDQIAYILREFEAIVHEPAIVRVVIHLDQLTPPAAFQDYSPLVVPIYNHLQTALMLALDGTLKVEAVKVVARELLDAFGYDPIRLTNSAEDLFRRRRPWLSPEVFERLAAEIRALHPETEGATAEALRETMAQIADRADWVRSRPEPRPQLESKPRDYVELFEREESRRAEARRAKKDGKKPPERILDPATDEG